MKIKTYFTAKLTDNWAFEIDVLKWFGSPGWFPIYENSLSAKIKGSHRGFYWSFYIIGLKLIELNVYDTRHEDDYENSDIKKKE